MHESFEFPMEEIGIIPQDWMLFASSRVIIFSLLFGSFGIEEMKIENLSTYVPSSHHIVETAGICIDYRL